MAAYNGANWIEEQISSVLAQTGVMTHLLISDDASVDTTRSLVLHLAQQDSRIQLHTEEAPSGSAGANFLRLFSLADPSNYSHVALCDQDDVWGAEKLSTACTQLTRGSAGLYSAAVEAIWNDGTKKVLLQKSKVSPADYLFEGAGQGCTFVMTVDFFVQIQKFVSRNQSLLAEIHYHDWLIYALGRCWNVAWVYDSQPCMVYRQHSSNDTGARGSFAGIRRRMDLVWSGWYLRQVQAMAAVCAVANPGSNEVRRAQGLIEAARHSFLSRLKWGLYLLCRSRRRFSDRGVLCIYALLGAL
jgi:rhamnosyltransferase